jgi:TolA-binding protein
VKALLAAALIALSAPYQCASDDERPPVEDSAPQALWVLAERFKAENNPAARETTLRQIVESYPSSRYAQRARQELGIADPVESAD